jgi:8-oxo-dGTP pyrophosphatase MutT (NUDIX family)
MLHAKLGIWVQPGGHAEGNANLAAVALREATEETGIDGLRIWSRAIDLDIHVVDPPGEDAHEHHDVRFLVVAPAGAVEIPNHESRELRWVTEDELTILGVDPGLARLARRGFALAAGVGDGA